MEIREADPSEAEEIVEELWLPLAREMEEVSDYNELEEDLDLEKTVQHKREKLENGDSYFYIAEKDGKNVGFISATVKDSVPVFARGQKLKINELFVKEEFRRKNAASKLMERTDELAEIENVDTVELEVNKLNESAQQLYRDHGFKIERNRMIRYIE